MSVATLVQPQRSLALFFIALTLWLPGLPGVEFLLATATSASAQTVDESPLKYDDASLHAADETGEQPLDPDAETSSPIILLNDLATATRAGGLATIATHQRLDLAETDRMQFEAYLAIAQAIELYPEAKSEYERTGDLDGQFLAGLDLGTGTFATRLSELLAEPARAAGFSVNDFLATEFNIQRLSTYDRSLIDLLIHSLTPQALGGAGQDHLQVAITKDHRAKRRTLRQDTRPPAGEQQKEAPYSWELGKGMRASGIGLLRTEKFTIKTTVNEKGEVVKEELEKAERLGVEPVQVEWQADLPTEELAGQTAGLFQLPPHEAAQRAAESGLLEQLINGADRIGVDLDPDRLARDFHDYQNLADAAKRAGQAALPADLETESFRLGKYSLLTTGQAALEEATGGALPAFGFFGDTLEEFYRNLGREVITTNLGLEYGALLGDSSEEMLRNAGERVFEGSLGLTLGALDGLKSGDRADLERRVGRGTLADFLNLATRDVPLGGSGADFQRSLGLSWQLLETEPTLVANAMSIPGTNVKELATSNPDELLRQIGTVRLGLLTTYAEGKRDAALGLEERPTIESLPTGSGADRARALLDEYAFRTPARGLLESIVALGEGSTQRFGTEFPSDDALRAWLLEEAYVKGSNPDGLVSRVNQFLAADEATFKETGIIAIARGLATDLDDQAALRQYLRDGTLPTSPATGQPTLSLPGVTRAIGFHSQAGFDAVFRRNSPAAAFAAVGRTRALLVFSQDETVAASLARQSLTASELHAELETLREATADLRVENRELRTQALEAIDTLLAETEGNVALPQFELPSAWADELTSLYQFDQAASLSGGNRYRAYTLALTNLGARSGAAVYELEDVSLPLTGGLTTERILDQVVTGSMGMTEGAERIGADILEASLVLDPDTLYPLNTSIERSLARGDVAGAEATIDGFARTQRESLGEAAAVLSRALTTRTGTDEIDPPRLARNLFSGTDLELAAGAALLDAGLELLSGESVGSLIRTKPLGGDLAGAVRESQGLRKSFELMTGRPNVVLSEDERAHPHRAATFRGIGNLTGIQYAEEPAEMLTRNGGAATTLAKVTGLKPPEIATKYGLAPTPEAFQAAALGLFQGGSIILEDGAVTSLLDRVASHASTPLPAGSIQMLFDRIKPAEEREAFFAGPFSQYLAGRLTPPRINGIFELDEGVTGDAIGGFLGTLTGSGGGNKDEAMRGLGGAVNAQTEKEHGNQTPWLMIPAPGTEKFRQGLQRLTGMLGIESPIANAAELVFIDDRFDMNTPEGREQLGQFVGSIGRAAKVPAEFNPLAGDGFVNGNIPGTFISFTGERFLDDRLRAVGIKSIGLADLYDAYVSPSAVMQHEAHQRAWDELIGDRTLQFGADVPTNYFVHDPADPTKTVTISEGYADLFVKQYQQELERIQERQQKRVQYATMDGAINRLLGDQAQGINVAGFSRSIFEGQLDEQIGAVGGVVGALAGSPEAAQIFGNATVARDLVDYFGSGKDLSKISEASFDRLDGFFSQATGFNVPAGSSEGLFKVISGEELLIDQDVALRMTTGYFDTAIGLPIGTAYQLYGAYENLQTAQAALDASRLNDFINSPGLEPGLLGDSVATKAAQANVNAATAGLVSLGVNLVFGNTFSSLDRSIGLPGGTTSLVATTLIHGLISGFTGALLTNVLLPGLGFLLLGLFGLFGGGGDKTQTLTREVILTSYQTGRWPDQVAYGDPDDPKTGPEIAFEKPDRLPIGVFPADTEAQIEVGRRLAANDKIAGYLQDLLLASDETGNDELLPNQILTLQKAHVEPLAGQLDDRYGDGTPGSYDRAIEDNVRRGVGWLIGPRTGLDPKEPPSLLPVIGEYVAVTF